MAIFYFDVKTFGRARGKAGSSATSAAAYRSGERIRDGRTGHVHDHSQRRDVVHKEIVLPTRFADEDMSWALDRANLWNAAELAERRSNARVAREYLVALPTELDPERRIELVRRFSRQLADRYQNAVDVAIHQPRPESDERNHHAHLLTTTREIRLEGLGLKTTLDIDSTTRQLRGLPPIGNEYLFVREQWANETNRALAEAGLSVRVDHRVGAERDRHAGGDPWIPKVAKEIERRGERSFVAERIRAERELVAVSRAERSAERESAVDVRRRAREEWLRMRSGEKASIDSTERTRGERGRDEDLSA